MLQLVLNKPTKLLVAVLLIAIGNVYAAEPIGGIIEQSGKAGSIVRLSGEELTANLQTDIVSFDEVETENGRLKIQFVDETQVSLTEHTYMEIDEYVYDPDPSKSKMALNFVQGTARFATGGLGLVPKENIQIQTPTATIGIRGTDFTTTVDELGRSLVILLPDANCNDKVKLEEGCRPSGSITVTNDGGTVTLEEAFQAVMVSTFEQAPTKPVVLVDLDLNQIIVKQNTTLNSTDNGNAFLGDGDNVTENVDGQRTGHSVATHRVWPYREAPHHYYETGDEEKRPITLSEAFTTSDGQLPLDLLPMTSISYVTNQAYMEELNSERSRIRVIAPKYIEQFAEDFEELINE